MSAATLATIDHTAPMNAGWRRVVLTDGSVRVLTETEVLAAYGDTAEVRLLLATTPHLLRAAYALTHRLHRLPQRDETRAERSDLHAQRDLIDAEIVRRAGE